MNNSVEWRDKEPYCTECETKLPGIRGFWFKNCPECGTRTHWQPADILKVELPKY